MMSKVRTQGLKQMMGKGIQTTLYQSNIGIKVQNGSKLIILMTHHIWCFKVLAGQ